MDLHVRFVRTLFEQIATSSKLKPLNLNEVHDWAAGALARVDRAAFFARFDDADAVRQLYGPFLQAFDTEERKALGVWYAPREIMRYIVKRLDHLVRTELGFADGLAAPDVWVLAPCCGTSAYWVEVLYCLRRTLAECGEDAQMVEDLAAATTTWIAGFGIMPAPFVIAHWQIGHAFKAAGAVLQEDQRAAMYLTTALTRWTPPAEPAGDDAQQRLRLGFPSLAVSVTRWRTSSASDPSSSQSATRHTAGLPAPAGPRRGARYALQGGAAEAVGYQEV